MNVVSLFSGCGGLDLGFERAGFNVIWANEFDKTIHSTYRLNHPNTILNTSDIRCLSASDIPDCDGIIGGPPCQSWSLGGRSLGMEDDRGKLVLDYIRIVMEKKPKFFIMENVPGILTMKGGETIREIIAAFREVGYYVSTPIKLNAEEYGVPQKRRRVIIIGSLSPEIQIQSPQPLFSDDSQTLPRPITVKDAIGNLPPLADGGGEVEVGHV